MNDMEIAVEGAQLDGMICLSSCDKTPPAHLMAAGRFNIPTILVIGGYQPSGEYLGKHVDIEDVFMGSVQVSYGKMSRETLAGLCDNAIRGPGVCAGMATANSMHIVCEALGMSLPGSAPVLANSERMFDFVRAAGARIGDESLKCTRARQVLRLDDIEGPQRDRLREREPARDVAMRLAICRLEHRASSDGPPVAQRRVAEFVPCLNEDEGGRGREIVRRQLIDQVRRKVGELVLWHGNQDIEFVAVT